MDFHIYEDGFPPDAPICDLGFSSRRPYGYCPGGENSMDWKNGPGTVFKPTGEYREKREGL